MVLGTYTLEEEMARHFCRWVPDLKMVLSVLQRHDPEGRATRSRYTVAGVASLQCQRPARAGRPRDSRARARGSPPAPAAGWVCSASLGPCADLQADARQSSEAAPRSRRGWRR